MATPETKTETPSLTENEALALIKRYKTEVPGRVKCDAPGEHVPVDGIIPAELAELMYQGDGKRRRILRTVYECGVFQALREKLRCNEIWVAGADLATALRDFNPPGAKPVSPGSLVQCQVAGDGSLTGCETELTSPDGMDYDRAAVALASRLRMTLWSAEAGPVAGGVVHVLVKREAAGD